MAGAGEQRVDKWLFFARIVKSRSLAQKLLLSGGVRVNREKIDNPAKIVRPGDVLTIPIGRGVKVLKILDPGQRRGPAPEAQTLYEDMTPPEPKAEEAAAKAVEAGYTPSERPPNKRERRALDRLRWEDDG
ncbi:MULTISPECIES: RNA-binding S4 domain-containing protein [unclassified Aureimonas]|uniref:RNA-binding S4 domain-containing protein n=1 Tax=unclassified Aureimonas TaxID=2615206 RepID=UPI0006F8F664|nr:MULTISPECIES: RNA-binding S4 domain-containing protein [unclassified Aureimonas]KQT69921.1 RNA-binding protein [Aureimonas sp. Leaf427]KQT75925.1 RNA-binding protein [Aureimonas sp. Leaf460]